MAWKDQAVRVIQSTPHLFSRWQRNRAFPLSGPADFPLYERHLQGGLASAVHSETGGWGWGKGWDWGGGGVGGPTQSNWSTSQWFSTYSRHRLPAHTRVYVFARVRARVCVCLCVCVHVCVCLINPMVCNHLPKCSSLNILHKSCGVNVKYTRFISLKELKKKKNHYCFGST